MTIDTDFLSTYSDIPEADIYMLGDGSGTVLGKSCGWFVSVLDMKTGQTYLHFGGANHGTNNYAELYPYIHALWHYQSIGGEGKSVTIISDSELTVKCGRKEYDRRANLPFWAAIDQLGGMFNLQWHHLPRNSTPYHKLADSVAGKIRKLLSVEVSDV